MKAITLNSAVLVLVAVSLIIFSWNESASAAAKPARVEILYMNHGPLRPTIKKIKTLLNDYQETIQAAWYDVNQQSGQNFMQEHKLNGHIPLLILVNGRSDFSIDGRAVLLQGFPTGASPFKQVEGNWSLDDLRIILDQQVSQQQKR